MNGTGAGSFTSQAHNPHKNKSRLPTGSGSCKWVLVGINYAGLFCFLVIWSGYSHQFILPWLSLCLTSLRLPEVAIYPFEYWQVQPAVSPGTF